jgi:integrase
MPRQSPTDNVRKICHCAKRRECKHPWYVWYREGGRSLRKKLADLVGREPVDFADAKNEARRAIVAWRDGRDARDLLPGDAPTVTQILDGYADRRDGGPIDRFQRARLIATSVNGRPLGKWRGAEVTREMIETFRRSRPRAAGNRDLTLLKAAFNWAVRSDLLPSTPFKKEGVPMIQMLPEEARTRRLHLGEEEGLLAAATSDMRDLILAALETGCRRGELLSLQWEQVREELFLPAGKTKAKKPRRVPISTVLRVVLDARRRDPAGAVLPPSAYVFGDAVGQSRRFNKKAWERAVLKAHGITPQYVATEHRALGRDTLTPECRAELRRINLHFHDLRREAGSRWMDAGVPLATIQRWLGHYNIAQTSTYLAASGGGDADAMVAFERAKGRLPYVAVSADKGGREGAPTHATLSEFASKNTTVH